MKITLEQYNTLATKEDLKKLANKADFNKCFDEVFAKLNIIMKKLDKIERSFVIKEKRVLDFLQK